MKHIYTVLFLLVCICNICQAQDNVLSQRSYGGSGHDIARKVLPTADGGYLLLASTRSTDGDLLGQYRGTDQVTWLLKADQHDSIQWQHCYDSIGFNIPTDIIALREGGYLIAGYTNVTGDSVHPLNADNGYLIKVDDKGNVRWHKQYGGSSHDRFYQVLQNKKGTYILPGYSESVDSGISGNHGWSDGWLVNIDTSGKIIWQHCYGGAGYDELHTKPIEDADGNYYMAGYSEARSFLPGYHGAAQDRDMWVIKTDASGNLLRQKCIGGTREEEAKDLVRFSNNNMCLVGYSLSDDGDIDSLYSPKGACVLSMDTNFNLRWKIAAANTAAQLVAAEELNGVAVAAGTAENISRGCARQDIYLLTFNSSGTVLKEASYGSWERDFGYGVSMTNTGLLYFCGWVGSTTCDVTGFHAPTATADAWVAKTTYTMITDIPELTNALQNILVYPNPTTGNVQIQFTANESFTGTMQMINILGETISAKIISVSNGVNTFAAPTGIEQLPKGIYILRMNDANGNGITQKIILE